MNFEGTGGGPTKHRLNCGVEDYFWKQRKGNRNNMNQPKFRKVVRKRPVSDGPSIWLRPLIWLMIALVAYFGVVTWLLPILVKLSTGGTITQSYHAPYKATGHGLRSEAEAGDSAELKSQVKVESSNAIVPAVGGADAFCEDTGEPPRPPVVEPREYFFAVDSSKVCLLVYSQLFFFRFYTFAVPLL